jgi:hypothetical protein
LAAIFTKKCANLIWIFFCRIFRHYRIVTFASWPCLSCVLVTYSTRSTIAWLKAIRSPVSELRPT